MLAAAKARRSPDTSPSGRRRRRGGHESEGGGREGGRREGGREGGAAEGGGAGGEASPAGVRAGRGRAGAAGHLRRGAHGAAEEDTVGRGRQAGREGDAPLVPEEAQLLADGAAPCAADAPAHEAPAPAPYEAPKSHGAKHHVKHRRPKQRHPAASDAEREAWVKERDADPHASRKERDHGAASRPVGGHERGHHPSRGGQSHRRTAADGGQGVRRPRTPEAQRRGNSPEAQRRLRSGKRPDSGAAEGMTKPGSAALAALTTGSSAQKFADSKRDEDGLLFA